MDCRTMMFLCVIALLTLLIANTEGRNKKVVIHVPYKVKKLKHTHTVYKTIHHHHTHHDHAHSTSTSKEHEPFHIPDALSLGAQTHSIAGIGIPEFLPDVPDIPLEIPDVPPHEILELSNRPGVPLYRRN